MTKRELLFSITKKDFSISHFSGKGAGGQHRNKHQNCVRLKHDESGTTTTGQSHRDRPNNLKEAFNNMVKHPKFKVWYSSKIKEVMDGMSIEDKVDKMMAPENLMVEGKEDGEWKELNQCNHTFYPVYKGDNVTGKRCDKCGKQIWN